jgi:hypothetical protein
MNNGQLLVLFLLGLLAGSVFGSCLSSRGTLNPTDCTNVCGERGVEQVSPYNCICERRCR